MVRQSCGTRGGAGGRRRRERRQNVRQRRANDNLDANGDEKKVVPRAGAERRKNIDVCGVRQSRVCG
ncbi:unnamed protein product [Linum trigynum]|uniref:Uncharacterized protein n=1 Tax=Linum trigynum TaxID=586398 RepID=A0AAV2EKM2_9ROSI